MNEQQLFQIGTGYILVAVVLLVVACLHLIERRRAKRRALQHDASARRRSA